MFAAIFSDMSSPKNVWENVSEMSRRLPDTLQRRPRNFRANWLCSISIKIEFSSLRQVSEMSPRRLHQLRWRRTRRLILSVTGDRDVSETCWRPRRSTARDVAKTSPWLPEMLRRRCRNWEDISEMLPRLPETSQRRPHSDPQKIKEERCGSRRRVR